MKKLTLAIFALSLAASPVLAVEHVRGYTRSDGTYVQPHYRSESNNSRLDNYSTQGNYNPYTGQKGYESPTPSYNSGLGNSYHSSNPYGSNRGSTFGNDDDTFGNKRGRY